MSNFDFKEKRFEEDIEKYLINYGGYKKGTSQNFDPTLALEKENFVNFIKTSQPKLWDRYVKIYDSESENKIVERFNKVVKDKGELNRKNWLENGNKVGPILPT